MTLTALIRSVPKHGREDQANEDYALADPSCGRAAIADGASTSARPELWARLLVESFVLERSDPLAPESLAALRRRWKDQADGPDLAWYAKAKLVEGAHATFVGLEIDVASSSYRARIVGDSCLLHLRQRELLSAVPIDDPAMFGRFPDLVSSRQDIPPVAGHYEGEFQPGDLLVLATDAIAKYLLRYRQGPSRVRSVARLIHRPAYFREVVTQLRRDGLLDNDDTTLCAVQTGAVR